MNYTNLSPELKKEINKAFTAMAMEAFKPLLEKDVVHFVRTYTIMPHKRDILTALSKEFRLSLNLIVYVVQNNDTFFDCKEKIVAKRNAVFINEYNKGVTIDELSQRYGLSKQSIDEIVKLKQKRRRQPSSSFMRVLDESFFSHKPEKVDKKTYEPKKKVAKKHASNSYIKTLNKMTFKNPSDRKGHTDYLKQRRRKLK